MSAVKVKVRTGAGSSTDAGPEARAVQRRSPVPLLLNALLVPAAAARDRPAVLPPEPGAPPGASAATLAERRALAHTYALCYARADKQEKTLILDKVCAATGWHRSHARNALLNAARPKPGRVPQRRKYDAEVVAALTLCWTILDRPAGKRLAPMLPELVPVLRRHRELSLDDESAELLMSMSAATISRRLAPYRQSSGTAPRLRPGSRPRGELPLVTWTEWDHGHPGFFEIAVVRHDGGTAGGSCLLTVAATDIATGWTEIRTVRGAGQIPLALEVVARNLPFPVLGLDCGSHGAEIDEALLRWCRQRRVTFTHARPVGRGSHHVGQQSWRMLHELAGHHHYDSPGEQALLNEIWAALSRLTNYFYPQQRSVSGPGQGGGRKEFETATPYRRTERHRCVTPEDQAILADVYPGLNPAELHRHVERLVKRLHLIAQSRAALRRCRTFGPGFAL
nr:putative integrase catalytic subunit [Streptomyces sp. CNQ-509]